MSKEEFIKLVTADQPEAPQYFSYDAILNRKERPTLEEALEAGINPLSLDEMLKLKETGAQLLDVRDTADFAGAHLAASMNISLGGPFATWAGTLLDRIHPYCHHCRTWPGKRGCDAPRTHWLRERGWLP